MFLPRTVICYCVDLQIVNCAGLVSKWVGDTPKNIDALFQEARATDAVLCFDEAEGLFGTRSSDMGSSTDRYAAMDVGRCPTNTKRVWVALSNCND